MPDITLRERLRSSERAGKAASLCPQSWFMRLSALLLVGKHLARDAKGIDRRRHSGIDRDLQENLANFVLGDAIGERSADMRLQLMRTVEDRDHRQIEHAAGLQRQAFAPPYGTPTIFSHEILQ